jgi:hypothetical protein
MGEEAVGNGEEAQGFPAVFGRQGVEFGGFHLHRQAAEFCLFNGFCEHILTRKNSKKSKKP